MNDRFLRLALRLDAVATGTLGLVTAAAAGGLDGTLGIPTGWLVGLGGFLVGYAAALLWLAARPRIPAALAWTVVVGNVIWALDSAVAVAADWFPMTAAGAAVVVAQAVVGLVFADLQYLGLRRLRVPRVPARA